MSPVVHLVPLVPQLFPRWNQATNTLVMDPPGGLLDLGRAVQGEPMWKP
jgi:hypothetical protein